MEIQLELNIENLESVQMHNAQMQAQVDHLCEMMSKVRKKLFAERSQMLKDISFLLEQNKLLIEEIRILKGQKLCWDYGKPYDLFDLKEA